MSGKKDPKRQLLGKIAKARGKQFESRIDDSFAYYAQKGFAIIEKTPEPMHPTKNLGNGKFIAYYEKQAQPDYKGTIKGGRTVMFEAKFTAADRMEQSRVLQSQQDYGQASGARRSLLCHRRFQLRHGLLCPLGYLEDHERPLRPQVCDGGRLGEIPSADGVERHAAPAQLN